MTLPLPLTPYSVPREYRRPLRPRQNVENGYVVSPLNAMSALANQVKAHRGKTVFASDGRIGPYANGTLAARDRWRFYFKTGPFTSTVKVLFVQAKQNEGGKTPPWEGEDARGIFTLYDASNVQVGQVAHHYGMTTLEPAGTLNENGVGRYTIDGLSPSTEYHGLFQDAGYGVTANALVYELPTLDAYLNALSPGGLIADDRREALIDMVNTALRNWCGQIYNRSADLQGTPAAFASTSDSNIWLGSGSTGFAASDPGITLDLTGKARSSIGAVPIKLWARMARSTAGGATPAIKVKDTSGTVLASLGFTITNTQAWQSGTFTLPPSAQRISIHLASSSPATTNLYALSLYENSF